jgi:hypothetical protein
MKVDEAGTAEAPGSHHADVRPVDGPYHRRRSRLFTTSATAAQSREGRPLLTVIPCPDCGVPAEVTERFSLPSTEGPVGHVALSCAAGHHFRMAVDRLSAPAQQQLAVQETRRTRATAT